MKIGVWVNKDVTPNTGGGFSYTSKLIKLINQKKFRKGIEICFVSFESIEYPFNKETLQLNTKKRYLSLPFHYLLKLTKKIYRLRNIYTKLETKNEILKNEHYKIQLKNQNIDIIYYLAQMEKYISNFPFISTNWDLGHIKLSHFSEFTKNGEFKKRSGWYNITLKEAVAIFSESKAGKKELINYLGIPSDKIKILPIFPGEISNLFVSEKEQNLILNNLNLKKLKYFFYPAQFWEHKNHLNLIRAFKEIANSFQDVILVFCGSDKGFLNTILSEIELLNISRNVRYYGFISNDQLFTLYKNSIAMVMPTLLGPTNMPLLEARDLDCPVLCSDFDGHREQMGDGAIFFDPNKPSDIKRALLEIMEPKVRSALLAKADIESKKSKFNSLTAINKLEEILLDLKLTL